MENIEIYTLRMEDYTKFISKSFLNTQALTLFHQIPRGSDIDFTNVDIDFYHARQLAHLMESFDHNPINLQHPHDIYVMTALHYIREPELTFEEFIENFPFRFPQGAVCLRDDLFSLKNPRVGKTTSVLYVEEIQQLNVRFRRYYASAFDEGWFARGGADGRDNYAVENITLHDLFSKVPFIRYPITSQELEAIEYFFPTQE